MGEAEEFWFVERVEAFGFGRRLINGDAGELWPEERFEVAFENDMGSLLNFPPVSSMLPTSATEVIEYEDDLVVEMLDDVLKEDTEADSEADAESNAESDGVDADTSDVADSVDADAADVADAARADSDDDLK